MGIRKLTQSPVVGRETSTTRFGQWRARVSERIARSSRVFLLGVVVACGVEVLVDWNQTLMEINVIRNAIRQKGESYVGILGKASDDELAAADKQGLERVTHGVFDDEDAVYVRFTDAEGKVVWDKLKLAVAEAEAKSGAEPFGKRWAQLMARDTERALHDPARLRAQVAGSRYADFAQAWTDATAKVLAAIAPPKSAPPAVGLVVYQDRLRDESHKKNDSISYAIGTVLSEDGKDIGTVIVAFDMTRTNAAVRAKYFKFAGIVAFFVGLILVQNVASRRHKLRLLDLQAKYSAAKGALRAAMPTGEVRAGTLVASGAVDQTGASVECPRLFATRGRVRGGARAATTRATMTIKKAKKRLVRARMAKTGETYQRAEREVSSTAGEGERPTAATEPPTPGTIIAGRYKLLRIVPAPTTRLSGERGAHVPWLLYDALHVLLGGRVQVKLLPSGSQSHLRAWLLREGRAVQRAGHIQVVRVFDIGETEEGVLYITLEEAPATTLDEYIETRGGNDEHTRAIVGQLTNVLERVHERGIVHCGVRNGAVHVEERDGSPFVKLSSFSFATLAGDPPLAQVDASLRHPAWMSPEQCRGDDADGRSDLYSLGVVLYSMLEHRLPFDDVSREKVLDQQRFAPPPPLAGGSALGPICMKLLAKDPADRYPSARDLQQALGQVPR